MNRCWRDFLAVTLFLAVAPITAIGAPQSPEQAVKDAIAEISSRHALISDLCETDTIGYLAQFEDIVSPWIDSEGYARGVLAAYYGDTTPAQRETVVRTIQGWLSIIIARTFRQYSYSEAEVLPIAPSLRRDPGPRSVGLELPRANGAALNVKLTLSLSDDNEWRLRNIVVIGINLGLWGRAEFAKAVRQNAGNVNLAVPQFLESLDGTQGLVCNPSSVSSKPAMHLELRHGWLVMLCLAFLLAAYLAINRLISSRRAFGRE